MIDNSIGLSSVDNEMPTMRSLNHAICQTVRESYVGLREYCAYLCFSNLEYGVAHVPKSLWRLAQNAEFELWKTHCSKMSSYDANDRAREHWKGFGNFQALLSRTSDKHDNNYLGRTMEVGAGPWTQLKGM